MSTDEIHPWEVKNEVSQMTAKKDQESASLEKLALQYILDAGLGLHFMHCYPKAMDHQLTPRGVKMLADNYERNSQRMNPIQHDLLNYLMHQIETQQDWFDENGTRWDITEIDTVLENAEQDNYRLYRNSDGCMSKIELIYR